MALVVRDGVIEGLILECNFVLDLKNSEKMEFNAWLLNDDECVNNNYYWHKSFTRGMLWPFSTLLLYESIMVSFLGAMLGCSSLFHPSFKNSILKLIQWMEMNFANFLFSNSMTCAQKENSMSNIIKIYWNTIKKTFFQTFIFVFSIFGLLLILFFILVSFWYYCWCGLITFILYYLYLGKNKIK